MHRWMVALLLTLWLAPVPVASTQAAGIDYAGLNRAVVEGHILPGYARLGTASAALDKAASASCTDIARLKLAWRDTMLAWQGVQHLRFGPAAWFNRHDRFAFWPDPRNVTQRQLAELFERQALPDFVTASVAIQGLTALERVLYDSDEAAKLGRQPFHCAWLKAVAANLAAIARDMDHDWRTRYAELFIAARGGKDVAYAEPKEATLELFKAVYGAVELAADHKLGRPLGSGGKEARPRLAEYWRSRSSGAAIAADLDAARDLYARFDSFVPDRGLAADLQTRFAALADAAKGIDLDAALAEPTGRERAEALRVQALELKRLLAERLSAALDIPVGFNALDGD